MVLKELNIRKLRAIGTIVLLTAEPATILRRVENNGERPLLKGNMSKDYIAILMHKRKPY